ncbi:MAG TPA: cobalamin biosynthesis protein, partial [Hyphomicrobium sp.]|nr:cobalamin biosynthesis protein [Hyphomicrobium sp.]
MTAAQTLFVLVGALALEATFGYPDWLYQRIGHPVSWIGRLISFLDRKLNKETENAAVRRNKGVLALGILIVVTGLIAWSLEQFFDHVAFGTFFIAALASTLVASRSLYNHVEAVARALDQYG